MSAHRTRPLAAANHGQGAQAARATPRGKMRGVRRWVVKIAWWLTLAACAAMAGMWVRSYRTADVAGVNRQTPVAKSDSLWSAGGYVSLRHWDMPASSKVRVPSIGWFYGHAPPAAGTADIARFLDAGAHRV